MIDIHVHILPGMDDGPSSLADSLDMARSAVKCGTTTVVATPHCLNGMHHNLRGSIIEACREFNVQLTEQGIPLSVLPGAEARLCPEILDELDGGTLLTLNDRGTHISLELPQQVLPRAVVGFIHRLKQRGVIPVISHPERNQAIQRDPGILSDLVSAGALSQITGSSLTGSFGKRAFECCERIVNEGLFHFMASDAHSATARNPDLSAAVKRLGQLVGEERAQWIMTEAPLELIA